MENIFKNNLVFLRESKNEKQAETATALGLSRSTYANYEVGENLPKADIMLKIIGHFGVGFEKLMSVDLKNDNLLKKTIGNKLQANDNLNDNQSDNLNANFEADFPLLNDPETAYKSGKNAPLQYQVKEIIKPVLVTVDTLGRENTVMVPVKARAGYLNGYADPEFLQNLPAYRLPNLNHGTFRIFEVEGLSNYPVLADKDLVITSYVEQARDIRDDRMYVLLTRNEGIVIKKVINRVKKDGVLILKSENLQDRHLYPPIVLNPEDILEIWYCEIRWTKQFGMVDLYSRVVDLEARLTLLEHGRV